MWFLRLETPKKRQKKFQNTLKKIAKTLKTKLLKLVISKS